MAGIAGPVQDRLDRLEAAAQSEKFHREKLEADTRDELTRVQAAIAEVVVRVDGTIQTMQDQDRVIMMIMVINL